MRVQGCFGRVSFPISIQSACKVKRKASGEMTQISPLFWTNVIITVARGRGCHNETTTPFDRATFAALGIRSATKFTILIFLEQNY